MKSSRAVIGILTAVSLIAPAAAAQPPIRGFTPAQIAPERRYEQIVEASPSEAQAMRDEMGLASYVHRMGQKGDLRAARYMRDQLAKAGWNAKLVEYVVPIAYPVKQQLTLLSPKPHDVDLYEPAVPGDPYSRNHAAISKPYSGYSVDGNVTGPVIYVNQGMPADYKALAAMHVNVRGAIALARTGGGALTAKAFEGAKHGVKAVLVFSDPMKGGYWDGDPYPKGPYRPTGAAMRNTMTFTNDPGDPTAIGIPVPGAKHKPFSAIKLPSIPEMPVTANVARELLAAMDGPAVPSDWHPGFAMAVHTGGKTRAHFILKSKRFFGPIWDVIATMPGKNPNQMVVAGGHRDSWTYGAVDPISGNVDLLQMARAFGKLKKQGWQPERTIVIGSWDGEELNMFGSDEWVQQHQQELRARCVAYMNTDEVAYGPQFGVYATPDLWGMLRDAATAVKAPDGSVLSAYWKKQDPKESVYPIGGGSDHEPFVYHEGLPGAGAGFGGAFGSYHSAYDDPYSLRIFDPGMHRAAAAARYTSMVVLRLADAAYPDLRLGDLASQALARLTEFRKQSGQTDRRAAVVAALEPQAQTFAQAASALDARAQSALEAGDVAKAQTAYAQLRRAEYAFFDASAPHWQRSMLYNVSGYASGMLPGLDDTLTPDGDAAVAKLRRAFTAATQAATP